MIMEYLLINHPLDCPVCDQAGQCGLQDYSFERGQATHRFVEERTVNPRKQVSAGIQLNQDRCIMCTRCVRFTREITRTGELQVMNRGGHAEIGIFPGQPISNPLAGNVVDLCPVGALLDMDFLHKQRAWYLSKHETVCVGCSSGCNMVAEENRGQLWRLRARANPEVNDYWICDEGRLSYRAANDGRLLSGMRVMVAGRQEAVGLDRALQAVGVGLRETSARGGKIGVIISPFATVEEAYLLAAYAKELSETSVLALGPVPVSGADWTVSPDARADRTGDTSFLSPRPFTIRAEKCPNRRGVEEVLKHFGGGVVRYEAIAARVEAGEFEGLVVSSGSLSASYTESDARLLRRAKFLVLVDTLPTPLSEVADVLLAGATFAEKAGSYVNANGRLQYSAASLPPREGSLPDLDIWTVLIGRGSGPARSSEVMAEVSRTIPIFAAALGGVPSAGLVLGESGGVGAGSDEAFTDPWFRSRSAAVDVAAS
jgi:NADH-quinone oxidoreductase subunit G